MARLDQNPTQIAAWCVIILTLTVVVYFTRAFLIPLAIAIILWVLVDALRDLIRVILPGSPPRWLVSTLALTCLSLGCALLLDVLLSQAEELRVVGPNYQQRLEFLSGELLTYFDLQAMPSAEELFAQLNIGQLLAWFGGSVRVLISDVLLIVLYLAFLIVEENKFPAKLTRLVHGDENASNFRKVLGDIAAGVKGYIGVKTLVSTFTGLLSYVVLTFVGVDFASLWALLIFFLNFIPNIGSILATLFPAILALLQFDTPVPAAVTLIGLGGLNFIIGNVLEPPLMGRSLNLSPFMILTALAFWGLLWGIPGMFLAVPITVMLSLVCAHLDGLRWFAVLLSGDGHIYTDKTGD